MLRKTVLAACVAAFAVPAAANNDQHVILILPDAFFPAVSYVDPGDTVRFINGRGSAVTVVGQDDAWETDPIPAQGEYVLVVGSSQATVFFDGDSDDDDNGLVQGTLTFDEPPLN